LVYKPVLLLFHETQCSLFLQLIFGWYFAATQPNYTNLAPCLPPRLSVTEMGSS